MTAAAAPVVAPVIDPAKPAAVVAPVVGSPEYDAAMAAKFDKNNAAPVVEPATKPEGVPDKFWNATTGTVDYVKWNESTVALEAAFTKSKQTPEVKPGEAPKVGEVDPKTGLKIEAPAPDDAAAAAAAALNDKGLDIKDFNTEYATNGALSEESYTKLAKVGFDKATVDSVIAGQVALAEKRDGVGYEVAGGKEEFAKMSTWAAANMTVGEREAFNAAVSGPSVDTMKLAVSGLRARYEAANGRAPVLVGGDPANAGVSDFKSTAEMTAAMRDPRYRKDPAYRASVEARVAVSKF